MSGRNNRSLPAAVTRLRKAELVQEMQLRGLPESGTRQDLRERLLKAEEIEQHLVTGTLNLLKHHDYPFITVQVTKLC